MQLGRFIERSQMSISLFLSQLAEDSRTGEYSEADWTRLLRFYHAFETYNRRYSIQVNPGQALDLLATDPRLPDSLCRSLDRTASDLESVGPGPDAKVSAAAMRLAGRTAALSVTSGPTVRTATSCCCRRGTNAGSCTAWLPRPTSTTPPRISPVISCMGGPALYEPTVYQSNTSPATGTRLPPAIAPSPSA